MFFTLQTKDMKMGHNFKVIHLTIFTYSKSKSVNIMHRNRSLSCMITNL